MDCRNCNSAELIKIILDITQSAIGQEYIKVIERAKLHNITTDMLDIAIDFIIKVRK